MQDNSIKSLLNSSNIRTATLKDKAKQSLMADASLYNGQLTDTNQSCPSVGLIPCTPSNSAEVRSGVSVGNAPIGEDKQWYVLRVSYGRVIKAKAFVEEKGVEYFAPMRYKQIINQGKKRIVTEPLLSSFIFVYSLRSHVEVLLKESSRFTTEKRPLISFYYDHTAFREDAPDKNPPLIISDSAMDNFKRLTSVSNPHIIPITSDNIKYKLGNEVVITEGDFKGVHGRVARIAGQQRVVVELFEGCLVATAYIPKNAMTLYVKH